MRNRLLALCSVLLVAALAAACASNAPQTTTGQTTTATGTVAPTGKTTTTQSTTTATTTTSGEPQYGGTLTILQTHAGLEPQTWDPGDSNWIVDPFTSPYWEKLLAGDFVKYGPRGTNQFPFADMEFVPYQFRSGQLAESWEQPDPMTTIYRLRHGVMFPNKTGVMASREMTANDVAFSLNRLITAPKQVAQQYYIRVGSITAQDKYTVVVKMKDYDFNWSLPLSWGYYVEIYPQELVTAGITNWKNAVGTGPFMLTDYVSGASLTYEKNPVYWGTTKISGKDYKIPFVDKLNWPIIVDEATRLAALRTGKCDINESVRVIYKKSLEDTNPDLARYRILSTSVLNISMREDTKPFDDIRVRQALSMAIDRQGIINSLQLGEAEMLSFPFAATWGPGLYTPLNELPQAAQDLFKYDPVKAKKLMTDAGYGTGFQTEMVVSSSGTVQTDTAAMVLSNWETNLGVKVTLKPADYATYLSIQYGKSFKGMYMMSKGNGDPVAVLLVIGPPKDQYWNPSMWDDATYADQFQQAREAADRDTAYKLLSQDNIRFIEQVPTVILPVGYYYAYAWPWVHNWYGEVNTNTRQPGLIHATIWIDRDLRQKMTGQK